jgi:acyl-CoA synthetase (AMP-forming)/AMP-acid ligase II
VTINSGGENIFAEEVERAVAAHPDVYDVVVGRPSHRSHAECPCQRRMDVPGVEEDRFGGDGRFCPVRARSSMGWPPTLILMAQTREN